MTRDKTHYLAYLLRLWRDSDVEHVWRASIESPDTGERRGFAGLDGLFAFLQQQTSMERDTVVTPPSAEEADAERTAGPVE